MNMWRKDPNVFLVTHTKKSANVDQGESALASHSSHSVSNERQNSCYTARRMEDRKLCKTRLDNQASLLGTTLLDQCLQ